MKVVKKYIMSAELTSIIATLVNVVLTILKLAAGIFTGSAAMLAEAIHSGLDIFSSLITFVGIKTAQKPADPKHPYGFYRAEVLAGALVALLLGISGVWIVYEGIESYLSGETPQYSYLAIGFMVISIVANEVMARLKFKAGNEHDSISLIADAEHSRADVISSAGVLLALVLIPYLSWVDSLVAIFVGIYVVYEAFQIGKEATDSLIDVSDSEVEQKIKEIAEKRNIKVENIKTRKIGSAVFAEMSVSLSPKLSVDQASSITKELEDVLDKEIESLKQIIISIDSHDTGSSTIFTALGGKIRTQKGIRKIGPSKKGLRIVCPINEQGKKTFGLASKRYMVIDKDKDGKEITRFELDNPYWSESAGHGIKFLKSVSADVFESDNLGPSAQQNLKANNIEYKTSAKK